MKAAGRLRRWLGDSLFKRLFVLMWAALVLSHVAAFAVVMLRHGGWMPGGPLPTFPSLPPTPGLPDSGAVLHGALQPPPHAQASAAFAPPGGPGPFPGHDDADGDWAAPAFPPGGGAERFHFGGLPAADLALDYGVRLLVIALAAWWGARWRCARRRRCSTPWRCSCSSSSAPARCSWPRSRTTCARR
jgi:protein-histidine pros-kinase